VQARETAHPTSPRRDAPDPETEWLTLLAERYAVLREGQSLVLVDLICFVQGVLAARMRTELQASTSLPSRPLLFPVRIECVDEAAAQRLGADLQALGLTLNPLGPKTLALRALPRVAPEVDAERLGRALAGGGVSTSDDLAAALAAAVTIPALANERTQWWQRWLAQASEAGIAPELFIRRLVAAALEQLTGRRNG
jgi:DNA mismatch repair ATPase MutL